MMFLKKAASKKIYGWLACLKRRTAAALIAALLLSEPSGAVFTAYGAPDSKDAAFAFAGENTFSEGEVSFVSFPARFEGRIPKEGGDRYYVFELDYNSDVTIRVDFNRDAAGFGAELLDSGGQRLFISQRKNGQRIIAKGEERLSSGRYILRVFAMEGADPLESFTVSMEKFKLSDSDVKKVDYSELHIVSSLQNEDSPWFMNGYSPDYIWADGGLVKVATPSCAGRGVDGGGINGFAVNYYHNWIGPVPESVMPIEAVVPPSDADYASDEAFEKYLEYVQDEAMAFRDGGEALVHVQNSIYLPRSYESEDWKYNPEANRTEGWRDQVKNAVMNYGAVSTTLNVLAGVECEDEAHMYDSGWRCRETSGSAMEVYNVFDMNESLTVNHNVAIVGWDDNYPREKFRYKEYMLATSSNSEKKMTTADDFFLPEEDGAWIVRNSWSSNMGDGGYFYVSYEDLTLGAGQDPACYDAAEASDNYNTRYAISDAFAPSNLSGMLAVSSVFTAQGSGTEVLRAVGFETRSPMNDYQIAINRGSDIGQGLVEENVCVSGFKRYAGTYTARLDKPILLEPGEPFEIVLLLNGGGEAVYPMICNSIYQDNIDWMEKVSFVYDYEEGIRLDMGYGVEIGGSLMWGHFPIQAFCYDSSLEDGEIRRNVTVPGDPSMHYLEIPVEETEATASNAGRSQFASYKTEETFKKSKGKTRDNFGVLNIEEGESFGMPETVNGEFPEEFDLRTVGVLPPVRSQEYTNTCWAFSNTAALESSYLLNGSNLYDYSYSSGIRLDTDLSIQADGRVLYRFDKQDEASLSLGTFTGTLLSWDDGPIEDADGKLLWQFSGDLSSADFSAFADESRETFETENGETAFVFEPKSGGILNVKVSSADDPTKTASCQIVLVEENAVNSLTVSPEAMTLKPGQIRQLTVTVDAQDGSKVTPVFTSARPEIAVVDAEGKVLALRPGVTVITVRAGDKEAVCEVTVTKRSGGGSSGSASGRRDRSGSLEIERRFPGIIQGIWSHDGNGEWYFRVGDRQYKNEWAYLYNPYALNNTGNDGWFYFDENGKMMTGWFTDWDGHQYYLNPVSDGEKGRMMTGWVLINGGEGASKWYYFNEEKGGPLGSLTDRRRNFF